MPGTDIRTLASGVIYEDDWMRLRRDEIERRDGSRGTYAFVEKPDFALVTLPIAGAFGATAVAGLIRARRRASAAPVAAAEAALFGPPGELAVADELAVAGSEPQVP